MSLKLLNVSKERNRQIEVLVARIRAETSDLDDYQRIEVVDAIMEGYCRHCGRQCLHNEQCYCTQDD